MIQSREPPLTAPTSAPVGGTMDVIGFEYAYWREIEGEPRAARALGKWSEVWERVDNIAGRRG